MAKWVRCFDSNVAAVVNIDELAMMDILVDGGWWVIGITPEDLQARLSPVYGDRRSAELCVEQLTGVVL